MTVKVDITTTILYIDELCTHCGRDTGWGTGLFIDRIPAYTDAVSASDWYEGWQKVDYVSGYLCRECLEDD